MSNLSTSLISLNAICFLAMGTVALIRPLWIVAVFGTESLSLDGRNEVRAVYGGFGIAIGLLLLAIQWLPGLRPGVLVAVSTALLGMAAGRVASSAIDGSPGRFPWLFFGVEVLLAGALLWALILGA